MVLFDWSCSLLFKLCPDFITPHPLCPLLLPGEGEEFSFEGAKPLRASLQYLGGIWKKACPFELPCNIGEVFRRGASSPSKTSQNAGAG